MRTRLNGSMIFSIFLILVFLVVIVLAIGYGGKARMAPLVVAIPGFFFVISRLVIEFREARKEQVKKTLEYEALLAAEGDPASVITEDTIDYWKELNPFLWITGLFLLIYVAGFMVAIPIYLFLYLKVRSNEKLSFTITFSLITWGVLYLFFVVLLKIPLYSGVIVDKFLG